MSETEYKRWICDACGYIYDEAKGDPDSGLQAGTRYDDIPDDWQCPLCGMMKSDLRLLPEAPAVVEKQNPVSKKVMSKSRGGSDYVVIIGAGVAGWSTAEAIRRRDPERPILLVSVCKGLVYPKPAISLAISQGRSADDLVETDAMSRAAELDIEVRTETRVLKVDTSRKRLTTTKGGIEYGKLVLALGAHQRELPIEGDAKDTILRVNDLLSFKKLQQRLSEGVNSVSILGAGLIGSEFADDLTRAGYKVTVIDPGKYPLSGLVPELMANELKQRLESQGVTWKFGVTLQRVEKDAATFRVELSDSTSYTTDLVLSAAGLVANTKLAETMGLTVDTGIAVDEDMRTSDENIYAIGDCASVDGRLYAYIEPIHRQAEAIAANLLGEHEYFKPIPPMIKVKTLSMPISVCKPAMKVEGENWQLVTDDKKGSYYEMLNADNLVGFALSDSLASDAGNYYQRLQA